jgi:pullulanase
MARSKQGDGNSYKSPDAINQINWELKSKYFSIFKYYQQLIKLRKEHPAFRMTTAEQIRKYLVFPAGYQPGVISFVLTEHANNDSWKTILAIFNGNRHDVSIQLPEVLRWRVVAKNTIINADSTEYISGKKADVPRSSMLLLVED